MALSGQKHETFGGYIGDERGTVPPGLLKLALQSQLETKANLMLSIINK